MSFTHLLAVVCTVAIGIVSVFPIYRIISRTGLSGWWSLIAFVPVANYIFLWAFALMRWPALDRR